MATPDLSKMTISREQKAFAGNKKSTRRWAPGVVGTLLAIAIGPYLRRAQRPIDVEPGIVASANASQTVPS